jgi:hypothetical protein
MPRLHKSSGRFLGISYHLPIVPSGTFVGPHTSPAVAVGDHDALLTDTTKERGRQYRTAVDDQKLGKNTRSAKNTTSRGGKKSLMMLLESMMELLDSIIR